jgi:hypothetical protein
LHRRNHHHAIGEIERLLVPPEKRLIIPPHAAAPPHNRCELTRPRGGRHTSIIEALRPSEAGPSVSEVKLPFVPARADEVIE